MFSALVNLMITDDINFPWADLESYLVFDIDVKDKWFISLKYFILDLVRFAGFHRVRANVIC